MNEYIHFAQNAGDYLVVAYVGVAALFYAIWKW